MDFGGITERRQMVSLADKSRIYARLDKPPAEMRMGWMKFHTVPTSAMGKVPSTAKVSCPVWQNTICGNTVPKSTTEHVSDKNQDMAVEIIFQCGDKDYFDEASPHMHVVTVPIRRGFKRGLETKVSNRLIYRTYNEEYARGR